MTNRYEPTMSEIDQKVAIGILQEQVKTGQLETSRRLERIEKKIDEQHYVSVISFEAYQQEVAKAFTKLVTAEQFRPYRLLLNTIGTAIVGSVVAAAAVWVLNGGLR